MLVKARKLVDEEVQAAPGLGGGWAGEQSGAAAGVGVGAIPYGGGMGEGGAKRMGAESKDGNTKNAATGMGMKEGRRVDELAWKQDWENRHASSLKSPWSSERSG
jgi:hypothetical protein